MIESSEYVTKRTILAWFTEKMYDYASSLDSRQVILFLTYDYKENYRH